MLTKYVIFPRKNYAFCTASFVHFRNCSTTIDHQQNATNLQQNTVLRNPMAHTEDIASRGWVTDFPGISLQAARSRTTPHCGASPAGLPLGCEGQYFAANGLHFAEDRSNAVEQFRNRLGSGAVCWEYQTMLTKYVAFPTKNYAF